MKGLIFILLLQIQCFTKCSSDVAPQKDYHHAETALYLWNRMKEVLLYLKDFSRPLFMDKCFQIEGLCPTTVFKNDTSLQWDGTPSSAAQAYFWQTYKCAKEKKIDLCPVDGQWGAWTDWSRCSGQCGSDGNMKRTRLCNNPIPNKNGFPCAGFGMQSKICREPCKSKHKASTKEAKAYLDKINLAYPELLYDCMEQHCTFEQIGQILDAQTKNKYWSSLQCVKYNGACPIDGGWSPWSDWSPCHPDCGLGTTFRFKTCTNPIPANSGLPCIGESVEEKSCFGVGCSKEDFIYGRYVSDWSPYGPCSEICDKYGEQIRRRICLQQGKCSAEFEDKNEITMSKPCYNGPCPVDGGWSKWSEFTVCSADCGAGRMTRVRLCNEPEPVGSASCLGYSISTKNCMGKCNVALDKAKSADGGNWDDIRKGYTDLAKLQDAVPSGDPYVYSFNPKLEENYTPWSKWTKCSKTCDVGYRKRQRTCKDKSRVCLGEVRQLQYCNTISCPVKGEWSDWMSWSPCTTTCGEGKHFRYRRCDNPLPRQGGTCIGVGEESKDCNLRPCSGINVGFGEWGTWELCSKSCGLGERLRTRSCNVQTMDPEVKKMFQGMGTRDICTEKRTTETSACNPKPCPVNGQWSTWNSWSECSENCGTGFHYRDRTCTQPAPANGGKLCQGPGSETIACFNGPCPDANHKGVIFNGKGWLKYEPRHKPIKFLALYLKFFPEVHSGMLLHRYKTCPKCNHHVKLYLEHGKATLLIRHKDAELKIQPKEKLKKKKWHTILVLVSGNVGFVRLNDGMHHYNGYTSPVGDEVSYDAPMIVGTDQAKKNGFKGMIAYLKVNFKELTLFDVAGWIGYGVPFDIIDTKSQVLDPVIDYPTFYGNSYMKLDITENKKISVAVSFWLKSLSGILLFNMGSTPGSYFFVNIVNGGLQFCFKCTEAKKVCQTIATLEVTKWYVISVYINENLAKIRLNNGKEFQMTSAGMTYRPSSPLFVGGGEGKDNIVLKMLTGHKKGFAGVIDNIVLNGESHLLKNKAIMNSKGYISSMGIGHIPMVTQIYEHSVSVVTLRCDYTQYFKNSKSYVTVAWFQGDYHIKSGSDQKIIPKLPGVHNVSAIVLSPSAHQNGIYACGIKTGGLITVTHAFVLLRSPVNGVQTSDVEVWIFRIAILTTPVILAICLLIVCWQVIKRKKRDKFLEIAGKVQEELKEEFKDHDFEDEQETKEKDICEETELLATDEQVIDIDLSMKGGGDAVEETDERIQEKESDEEEEKGDISQDKEIEEADKQICEEDEGDKIREASSGKDLPGASVQSMKVKSSFDNEREQLLRSSIVSYPPDSKSSMRSVTSTQFPQTVHQVGSQQRSMRIRPSHVSTEDVFKSPSDRLSKQQSINLEAQMSMAPLPAGSPSPPRNLPSVQSTPKSFLTSRGSVAMKNSSMLMPKTSSRMFPPQVTSIGPSMSSPQNMSATSFTRDSSILLPRDTSYPSGHPSVNLGEAPLQSIYISRSSQGKIRESSTSVSGVVGPAQPPDVDNPVELSKSNLSSRVSVISEKQATIPPSLSSSINARSNASSISPPFFPPPPIPMMTTSVNDKINDGVGIQSSKSGASSVMENIESVLPSDVSESSDMPPSPPGPPPTPPPPM